MGFFSLLVSQLWLLGCPGPDDPCGDTPFGCEDNPDDFQLDPTCELTGDLDVELGQGESSYSPLGDGVMPEVHFGLQGAQHLFLATRVNNVALDRYSRVRVRFDVYLPGEVWQCPNVVQTDAGADLDADDSDAGDSDAGDSDTTGTLGACDYLVGSRVVTLGVAQPIRTNGDILEEFGFLVQMDDYPRDDRARIELRVEDPCGRTGTVIHEIP